MAHLSPEHPPTACFFVQARSDPQVMPRVLELFAKRGLVPAAWHSAAAAAAGGDELHIDIQIEDMDQRLAGYIAQCLRQVVGVETVLVSEKNRAKRA